MLEKEKHEVEFYADMERETDLAYLFSDGINKFWLPKSQVIEIDQVGTMTYKIIIPEWLAIKKEII